MPQRPALIAQPPSPLLHPTGNKDRDSHLRQFAAWMHDNGWPWWDVDLAVYRDWLLHARHLKPNSVEAHLASIRGRYRALLRDRQLIYDEVIPPHISGIVERKTYADEIIARLANAIDPASAPVSAQTVQDRTDRDELRLTPSQGLDLLRQPGIVAQARSASEPGKAAFYREIALRDTALIALALATGARVAEVLAATPETVYARKEGELGFDIQHGKGNKRRFVPYGALQWLIDEHVTRWVQQAEQTERASLQRGRLFALTSRAAAYRIEAYPIVVDGEQRAVKWHDLRRTYARRLWDAGAHERAIQANLGHADLGTTMGYIGDVDFGRRVPQVDVYRPGYEGGDFEQN